MDAGIGHGIDSFYEYLIKSFVYFDDLYYFQIFNDVKINKKRGFFVMGLRRILVFLVS